MKYLIKTSGRIDHQAAHELAPDGVTALCGQKMGFPQAGVNGWEIQEFEKRPWIACSRCRMMAQAATRPPKVAKPKPPTKRELAEAAERERLERWLAQSGS